MAQPVHASSPRSAEQVGRERAMGEVSDVLLLIDHALERAKRARKTVAKDGADGNAELALAALIADLTQTRKRFVKDTYYAGEALRLL